MAIRKGKHFSGRVGNLVRYTLNNKECIRSLPFEYAQSEASQIAGKLFGQSSRMGSLLRSGLDPLVKDISDPEMYERFRKAISNWLKAGAPETSSITNVFSFIDRFQFNREALLCDRLAVPLLVDWQKPHKIVIDIPALLPSRDIGAPAFTETIHWIFGVAACTVNQKADIKYSSMTAVDTIYDESISAREQIAMEFDVKPNELVIVAASLRYTIKKKGTQVLLNDRQWMPVGIIGHHYEKK